jgi:hypothetical protein
VSCADVVAGCVGRLGLGGGELCVVESGEGGLAGCVAWI